MTRELARRLHFAKRRRERSDLSEEEAAEIALQIRSGQCAASLYRLRVEKHEEVWRLVRRGRVYSLVWSWRERCLVTLYEPSPTQLFFDQLKAQ